MTTLQSADLDQVRRYFDLVRGRVLAVTTGLTEHQWRFKPAPHVWSIAENLEHVVIVQERVLAHLENLAQAPPPEANRDSAMLDALVLEKIPDRSIRVKGPEALEPTGTWDLEMALGRHARNCERLIEFVESTPDLRGHVLEAPPLKILTNGGFQTMDGYQWALTAAGHDERHVRQILEVKADAGYPAA